MSDTVTSILVANIIEDFIASAFAEIDVEIGGRDALRVEETFKEKFEAQGIDISYLEKIGHEAAGPGATSRANGDGAATRPVDEIPDDEEIIEEAGLGDGGEFVVHTLNECTGLFGISVTT